MGELGERLRLDSGTLTPLLKRLESAGLVVRRRDARDERRVLIELTDEGWALRERVAHVPKELFASLAFSPKEATQLRQLLAKVIDSVDGSDAGLKAASRRARTVARERAAILWP